MKKMGEKCELGATSTLLEYPHLDGVDLDVEMLVREVFIKYEHVSIQYVLAFGILHISNHTQQHKDEHVNRMTQISDEKHMNRG